MTKLAFAITGVGGNIAPRHLRAIRDTGHRLVAALDPNDSVGVLDSFDFDVRFFTETERFDRHLEKLRRGPAHDRVRWITVASPNHLHDAHCRMALRLGADVLCEKPVVVSPWNVDALAELEAETGHRVWTILQLRVHDKLLALRERLAKAAPGHRHEVELTYVTARGPWYDISWKGDPQKSGGIPTNIGVHFFDLLLWLFGDVDELRVHLNEPRRTAGYLALERADVSWFLSVEPRDLPFVVAPGARTTHRSIRVDGEEIDFSEGFTSLHTRVYEETLAGRGFGLADAKGSIALAHRIRNAEASPLDDRAHPLLRGATRAKLVRQADQHHDP